MSIKIVWKYLSKYKQITYWTIFLSGLYAFLSAVVPFVYGRMFDLLVTRTTPTVMAALLALTLLIGLVNNRIMRRMIRNQYEIASLCEKDFVVGINSHLLKLRMPFYEERNSGENIEKVSRGAMNLNYIINQVVFTTLASLFVVLIVLIVMYRFDYRLGILFSLIMVSYFFEAARNMKPLAHSERELNEQYENLNGKISNIFDNILSIKIYTAEAREGENLRREYEEIILKNDRLTKTWTGIRMRQSNVMEWGKFAVWAFLLYSVYQGTFSVGQVLTVVGYMGMIFSPLYVLSENYVRTKRGLVSIQAAESLLGEETEAYGGMLRPVIKGNIEIIDMSAFYGDRKVLQQVNLKIKSGDTVAFVGESGAGKSTFAKLFLRLLEAEEGRIMLDGIDIRKINLEWLRKNIAYVPQNIILFDDTIMANIRYARPGASDEEVTMAARGASACEFIERLPDKYNQVIGTRGVKLSGGEKQRIAIAMALLEDPQIIILDEATSSLDSETEMEVQKVIETLSKETNKTIIVIAHRLSTVVNADKIFVFEEGRIIEEGTHEVLMRIGGVYKRFCELQSF